MRKLKRWTKEELDFFKKYYPILDNKSISKRLDRTMHCLRNKAYQLGIKKYRSQKKKYCSDCGKEIWGYGKGILCRSCSAKKVFLCRGGYINSPFTKQWEIKEIELLKREYLYKPNPELSKILNRTKVSIVNKAKRLGLKKKILSNQFWFTSENNPMHKKEIRKKVGRTLKENYKNGKIKITGIAKKSMLGLTKKENHPNWLGGISFEPYDKNWDDDFKESIRERDGRQCVLCHKSEEIEIKNGQRLCVHHIDYDKLNSIDWNCVSLCNSCHCKTHYHRKKWQSLFYNLISKKYIQKCIIQ